MKKYKKDVMIVSQNDDFICDIKGEVFEQWLNTNSKITRKHPQGDICRIFYQLIKSETYGLIIKKVYADSNNEVVGIEIYTTFTLKHKRSSFSVSAGKLEKISMEDFFQMIKEACNEY